MILVILMFLIFIVYAHTYISVKEEKLRRKAKKELIIVSILFIIAIISMFDTWKAEARLPKKSPTKKPTSINLDGFVVFKGNEFRIINRDTFNWTNVEMEINSGFFGGGFTLTTPIIRAQEVYIVDAMQFAKNDGTRFNPVVFKPKKFTIRGDTPSGRAYWYGGWE